ncbi:MAG TPA: hypothetical protein VFM18_23945 [Methanosarcina sp.]|nr:hypothetical protein [Methanosarcina sp.]
MKLKVSTSKDAISETSGSNYIAKSGVYDVTIKFASLDVSKNGAESVNFNIDYNGNEQTIYGPYITDKNGDTIDIGAKLINKLAVIIGMEEGDSYEIDEETHAVGKDKKRQDFSVITNFSNQPIKIHLQEEYSISKGGANDGQIRKSMVIKNFFRTDGASAEEIVNGTEVGKRLASTIEKYAANVTYRDDLTPEMVEEWKKARASESSKPAAPTPKATPKKPGSVFK